MIDDLGYESSLVARSLRSQRTNVIGILVADIEPFSAELLKGAAKALRGSDFEMVVYAAGQHNDRGVGAALRVAPQRHAHRRHDPRHADRDRRRLDPAGRRRRPARRRVDAADDRLAELRRRRAPITEHLIDLGHRRIGFLAGRPDLESARRREAGYRAALDAAGIAFDPDLVRVGGFTGGDRRGAGPRVADALGRDRPRSSPPTTCRRSRRCAPPPSSASACPTRCRSSASTTSPSRRSPNPPLTTVDQSIQAHGDAAVRTLARPDRRSRPQRPQPSDPHHAAHPARDPRRRTAPPAS